MATCNSFTTSNSAIYQEREYIKVGTGTLTGESYIGLLTVYPKQQIANRLVSVGKQESTEYQIRSATLSLTLAEGYSPQPIFIQMVSPGASADETANWNYSSTSSESKWKIDSNYADLIFTKTQEGTWKDTTVTFDIGDFLDLWKNIGTDSISFFLKSLPSSNLMVFNSNERTTASIGNKELKNCKFLREGNPNNLNTEGVRVVVYHYGNNYAIEYRDETENAEKVWKTINNSISKGNSFAFKSDDEEQGTVLGNVVCTLLDKQCNKLIVSGFSFAPNTLYYATGEFSGNTKVSDGIGIIEVENPDAITVNDLKNLQSESELRVDYLPSVINNNARVFTVDIVVDETLKNSRYRIYTKEMPYTENRTGKATRLISDSIRPKLKIQIATQ